VPKEIRSISLLHVLLLMKIISWNLNGIRSVSKKGIFEPWVLESGADILNFQEIKATPDQIPSPLLISGLYKTYVNSARKKGYSGVLTYTKEKPLNFEYRLGIHRFDEEGRMIRLDYEKFTLYNLYIPNGGMNQEAMDYKLSFYDKFIDMLASQIDENIILVGDFNIAHTKLDLFNPSGSNNSIMFTPSERERLEKLIQLGFVDTFRLFEKSGGHYSWWAYPASAREEKNRGWRIDYVFVSPSLKNRVKDAFILKDVHGSDHCPVGIEIDL
jgi:exodeoxyribonuclease-3